MAAHHSATFRAAPLCLFLFQELLDAMLFDESKVLYHAHVVFGSVTLIEGFEPAAGKILAFITEPYKSFPNQVTVRFHKNTIFTAWQAAGAVCPLESFHFQVILHCEVGNTYSAVHPTGGN